MSSRQFASAAALFGILLDLRAQDATGRVVSGAKGVVATVDVTNRGAEDPIEPSVRLAGETRWVRNLVIQADTSGPLAPGRTRRFTARFDIAPDAPSGARETLRFEVSAPGGELFNNPTPEIVMEVAGRPVLVLTSVSLDGTGMRKGPVTRFSEKLQGEWRLKPFVPGATFSDQQTETAWMMESTLALPKQIPLGEDFAIGVCGTAALQNKGGSAPRAADRLQLSTEVSVSPGSNYARSYQQFSLPAARGEEALKAQVTEIRFRFDAASSKPPSSYVYRAEARQAGENQNDSRLANLSGTSRFNPGPPVGLAFTFGTRVQRGLLGADTTIEAPPAAFGVRIEQALFYGLTTPDSGMITLHESAYRSWDLVYRVPRPGETIAALNPAPLSSGCHASSIGGSIAPVSAVPPPPNSAPRPNTLQPNTTEASPAPNSSVVISDLRGRKADEAARTLRAAGLQVRPRIGAAAPREGEENTVASLLPGPGTRVERGATVELVVHGPFSRPSAGASVPLLEGLLAAEAKAAIERAGLKIRPEIGPAAATADATNRVKSQEPAAGTSLASGAEVKVVLFGPPQVARVRTLPKILPPPPARTFSCPAPAGQWSSVNAQATSDRYVTQGRVFYCYYRHPQLPPVFISIDYRERGYHGTADACPSDAKANRYITSFASLDTRGMSSQQERDLRMTYWGLNSLTMELYPAGKELHRNVVDVVVPGLMAQVAQYAEPCSAPLPPIVNCDDNALCAVRCPSIQGAPAKQPVVSPRSIWSNEGHAILSTCGPYAFPGVGYTYIYAEVDADQTMAVERKVNKGKCGTSSVRRGPALGGLNRQQEDILIVSGNQRVSVRASGVPVSHSAAAGEVVMDIFNQLEPRSFLPCIP